MPIPLPKPTAPPVANSMAGSTQPGLASPNPSSVAGISGNVSTPTAIPSPSTAVGGSTLGVSSGLGAASINPLPTASSPAVSKLGTPTQQAQSTQPNQPFQTSQTAQLAQSGQSAQSFQQVGISGSLGSSGTNSNSVIAPGSLRMIPQVPIEAPVVAGVKSSPIAQAPPRSSDLGVGAGGAPPAPNMIKPIVGRPLPRAGAGYDGIDSKPDVVASAMISNSDKSPNANPTTINNNVVVNQTPPGGDSGFATGELPAKPTIEVADNKKIGAPPQTVTALSSVSSNQVPAGAGGAPPAPPPPKPSSPPQVEFAKPKKSPLMFIPIIIGVLLIAMVGALGFILMRNQNSSSSTSNNATSNPQNNSSNSSSSNNNSATTTQKTVLQYWGLWEPGEAFQQVIDEYQALNPNVTIQYTKQSHMDYRSRLQNAIASGNGPDLFRYHASWVPMLKSDLASLPSSVMSSADFQQTFYPVAIRQLQNNGTPVGIPLMYDGLVLFYNEEIFATAVEQPPSTWAEVRALAKKLRLPQDGGKLERASIAMGTTGNVEHFADILAILSLQNGADLAKPGGKETIDALSFYSLFAKEGYWDETMPSSTTAFARGDVAMMFAPSWRAHDIKQMNPNLKFATVPIPQLDTNNKIAWATYWAEGVSSKSKSQKEAWEFLKYLSTKEVQQKLYNAQSQIRAFGEPYSRIDLASQLIADRIIGAFLSDAPKAQGWYMSSYTHDRGINDEIIKYYEDAINSIAEGRTPDTVVDTLSAGVQSVLQKYGVSSSASPAQSSVNSSTADPNSTQGF